MHTQPRRAVASVLVVVATLAAGTLLGPIAGAAPSSGRSACYDRSLPTTVEEQRLDIRTEPENSPAAKQILARTGFDKRVRAFDRALCRAAGYAEAKRLIRHRGTALWAAATYRAQHDVPAGTLPATDDRGLYWARISMAKHVHQWAPTSGLSQSQRDQLIHTLEYTSRGMTTDTFSGTDGVTQVLVTGFDPFTLDQDIRIGNPSGANALSLDGQTWQVGGQTVEIQTAMFPVRYADFDDRMAEHVLTPHYRSGAQQADMVMTVSQGRIGVFDLEVYNGRRRSVSSIGDNNNVQGGGTYTKPIVPPGMSPGPEFLKSSLPYDQMAKASVPPFTTRVHTAVVEIPKGETDPVVRVDGPTKGSTAVEGGGGGYLSNEMAYRNTLLRKEYLSSMPAGHLHVPVLQFGAGNPDDITDPTYEANREAIVNGAHAILRRGIAALG